MIADAVFLDGQVVTVDGSDSVHGAGGYGPHNLRIMRREVLSGPILSIKRGRLKDPEADLTMVGGKGIFRREISA